ncbi:MAG TPA: AAA family ATPase [Burkholderiales bacterium]|nr:AAA family ATPase [Burkholderiales bacterium]
MKIAVVSPNSAHLKDIGRYLQTEDGSRAVALHEGGMTKVRVVADQQRPDLIILDSMCRDLEELPVLEYVSAQHPQTVVVMLCANHNPEFLINAMRAGVREVLQSPATKGALVAAVERIERRLGLGAKPRQPGQIIAFIPCKGGSGATFLATNVGYQLAVESKKVVLIDLNLQFGDAALFVHDHKPATNLGDVAHNIHRLDASFLAGSLVNVAPNYGLLAAPEDPGQAMEVKPEHVDVLLTVAADNYDFVIVDVGRVLDAVTIKALDRANYVFPVMQLTLPFIRDANRLISAFRTLGYSKDKIRLVVNRFEKGSEIKLDDVERSLGVPTFKTLPNSYEAVASAVNHGRPIASFARNNPVAKGLQELAHTLVRPSPEGSGVLGKLLRFG